VKAAVESALSLTRGQILERAEIAHELDDVPPVMMDEGRLGQVMVNLLVNAAQAIPRGQTPPRRIKVTTKSDGSSVEIEVFDTGVGVPPENLARIWQPFFTTKTAEAGTGLGLAISKQIVERAGGSVFRIRLPVAGEFELLAPPAPPSSEPELDMGPRPLPLARPRRARVLIVEDEQALAGALAEEIGALHDVVIARGAEAALARLAAERFDVVLCDLRMPGMSGDALYKRVRAEDPEQADRFVFMTGVGFGADLTRFLADSGRLVLEKPFSANRVLEAIRAESARAPLTARAGSHKTS
jgi:CheY-like chemotaxis protein